LQTSSIAELNPDNTLSLVYPKPTFAKALSPCSPSTSCTQQQLTIQGKPQMTNLADLDGDQDLDLIIPIQEEEGGSLRTLINDGTGRFPKEQVLAKIKKPTATVAADLDTDSDIDLVAVEEDEDTIDLFWHDGERFLPPVKLPAGDKPILATAADLDGDLDLDLSLPNTSIDQIGLLFQDTTAHFSERSSLSTGFGPLQTIAVDIDNDADNDLVVVDWRWGVGLFKNNGAGVFSPRIDLIQQNHFYRVRAADIDKDSDADLVAINISLGIVSILLNNGHGEFVQVVLRGLFIPDDLAFGDVNKDSALDLVITSGQYGAVWIMLNEGGGEFVREKSFSSFSEGTISGSLQMGDLNGDGAPELILTAPIPWLSVLSFSL
jgi:hypothetical protein